MRGGGGSGGVVAQTGDRGLRLVEIEHTYVFRLSLMHSLVFQN